MPNVPALGEGLNVLTDGTLERPSAAELVLQAAMARAAALSDEALSKFMQTR